MRKYLFSLTKLSIAAALAGACMLSWAPAAHAQSSANAAEASTPSMFSNAVDKAADLVMGAVGHLGIQYKRGGTSPETGFDCSGFVRHVYQNTVGLLLPRTSADMASRGSEVNKTDLKPGDLVFFNTLRRTFSHVGIYIGEGKFVHAPSSGGQVRVESMSIPYWQTRFNGARRMDDLQPLQTVKASTSADTSKPSALPAAPAQANDPLGAKLNELKSSSTYAAQLNY
jgi:hypothetical protein